MGVRSGEGLAPSPVKKTLNKWASVNSFYTVYVHTRRRLHSHSHYHIIAQQTGRQLRLRITSVKGNGFTLTTNTTRPNTSKENKKKHFSNFA